MHSIVGVTLQTSNRESEKEAKSKTGFGSKNREGKGQRKKNRLKKGDVKNIIGKGEEDEKI